MSATCVFVCMCVCVYMCVFICACVYNMCAIYIYVCLELVLPLQDVIESFNINTNQWFFL